MNVIPSPEVAAALKNGEPVLALESTVISHGLPWPHNLALAQGLEAIVREVGATPATTAIIGGELRAGLDEDMLTLLADGQAEVEKASRRDLGAVVARKGHGATTVAATMMLADAAGIRCFATGGIGGVHRGDAGDVSADLIELSRTPVAVICAGAKAILDLPRTLEWLETFGVPVVGYGTDELPAFYTRSSGLALAARVDTPQEAAALLHAHWGLGLPSGVLLAVPLPEADALDADMIENAILQALAAADAAGITGKAITPYLLDHLATSTGGASMEANLALLRNDARVGAEIAVALAALG